ncbi:MAG: biotin--[acetyl-CoA-carboxylase] ligase, partial [Gemmatimonadales bacterium]
MTADRSAGAELTRRWDVPHCLVLQTVTSTLDAVHRLAAHSAPGGSVVIAAEQTAGRGRDGRTWHSPRGGAWIGVLLRPPFAPQGVLAIRAGLAVADVVDEMTGGTRAQLKWPNDVLVDGRKLAGILCEGRWQGGVAQWLALGVGVNVENPIPREIAAGAIALRDVLPDVRLPAVLDRLVPGLSRLPAHGAGLTPVECAAFARRDWLHGRRLAMPLAGR